MPHQHSHVVGAQVVKREPLAVWPFDPVGPDLSLKGFGALVGVGLSVPS